MTEKDFDELKDNFKRDARAWWIAGFTLGFVFTFGIFVLVFRWKGLI